MFIYNQSMDMFTQNNFESCIFFLGKKYWWQIFKELINTSSLPSIHLFILQHPILYPGSCYTDWDNLSPYIPREVSDGSYICTANNIADSSRR